MTNKDVIPKTFKEQSRRLRLSELRSITSIDAETDATVSGGKMALSSKITTSLLITFFGSFFIVLTTAGAITTPIGVVPCVSIAAAIICFAQLAAAFGKPTGASAQAIEKSGESPTIEQMREALAESKVERRMLFEKANDIICSISPERKVLQINHAVQRILGLRVEDLVGGSVNPLIGASDEDTSDPFGALISQRSGAVRFETSTRSNDGKLVDLLWSVYWSATENTYSCVAHDITLRRGLERRLIQKQEQLRAFTAAVSHDLRTPVAAIKGFLDCLVAESYGPVSEVAVKRACSQN